VRRKILLAAARDPPRAPMHNAGGAIRGRKRRMQATGGRRAAVLLVLATAVAYGGSSGPGDWLHFALAIARGAAGTPVHDLVTAGSGEQVLPPAVRDMLVLLRGNRVASFRLSPAIADNNLWRQRVAEAAYPIRETAEATHVLLVSAEALPVGCAMLAAQGEVALADCR
jgi:hypothetical protein